MIWSLLSSFNIVWLLSLFIFDEPELIIYWPEDQFTFIPWMEFSYATWSTSKNKITITEREVFINIMNHLIWSKNSITHFCLLTNFAIDLESEDFVLPIIKIFRTFKRCSES